MARRRRRRRPDDPSPWSFAGLAGLVSALFLYGAGGLLAPWWVVVLLLVAWVVLFVQACRWFTSRPRGVVVLAGAAVVLWFAVMVGGGIWLGWTWSGE